VSQELQTGSTGMAVEAVPEREVSCLSLELQTWLLQWAVAVVLVDGSSCLSTAAGCSCGTGVMRKIE